MKWCLGLVVGVCVAACGGSVDDKNGTGDDGLETCPDCTDPNPDSGLPGPSDPKPTDPTPTDPEPVPMPKPTPEPHPVIAFAIFERDMPPLQGSGGTSGSTGGSGATMLDPNTLHLVVGNSGASCTQPREIAACGEWTVRIPLPPALQQVGTIPLSAVYGLFSSGDEPRSPEPFDCAMGAGSFSEGWLTIHELADGRIVFSLSETWTFSANVDVNGRYDAVRCQSN